MAQVSANSASNSQVVRSQLKRKYISDLNLITYIFQLKYMYVID
jgi:hypothetical protein